MEEPEHRLPREVLDHIARDAEPRHYGDGDILFREGDPSDCLYVLLKGQLKVYSRNANGREMVTRRCGPSSFWRSCSLSGEPIMKLPAGMTTISGQASQSSRKVMGRPSATEARDKAASEK